MTACCLLYSMFSFYWLNYRIKVCSLVVFFLDLVWLFAGLWDALNSATSMIVYHMSWFTNWRKCYFFCEPEVLPCYCRFSVQIGWQPCHRFKVRSFTCLAILTLLPPLGFIIYSFSFVLTLFEPISVWLAWVKSCSVIPLLHGRLANWIRLLGNL